MLSLRKEGNSDTGCDVDEPGGHHAGRSEPVTEGHTLCGSTVLRFMGMRSRTVVAVGCVRVGGAGVERAGRFSFAKPKRDLLHNGVSTRTLVNSPHGSG